MTNRKTISTISKVENRVVRVDECAPHERNYNEHSDAQIDDIRASLREFGQVRSIVVQVNRNDKRFTLVAGEGVWTAAKLEGIETLRADVIPASWSKTKVLAYLAADNEIARHSDPDQAQLAALVFDVKQAEGDALAELAAGGKTELDLLLSTIAIESNLEEEADVEELVDKAGELQAKWQVQTGDVWMIASKTAQGKEHRIMCGDSTNADDVARLMGDDKAVLMSTDPPYMVNYDGTAKPNNSGKDWSKLYREKEIKDKPQYLLDAFQSWFPYVLPNAAWFVWYASRAHLMFENALTQLGILIHEQIIWVKPAPIAGFVKYAYQHEPCMFGWRKGHAPRFPRDWFKSQGDGKTSVWHIDYEGKKRSVGKAHPTQKPLEIFARPIRNHTVVGEICAEPFSGSGSQLIAAEMSGRVVRAMEIEPAFVAVALERASLLGLEPQRTRAARAR